MDYSLQLHPARVFSVLHEAALSNRAFFKPVTKSGIIETAKLVTELELHDKRLINVRELTRRLGQLKTLPSTSPLLFLGLFAILESLLTHKPKHTDPYDSITRQVHTKLALLQMRLDRTISYVAFKGAKHEKIWKAMYSYRSAIAHGDTPDVADSDFRLLVGKEVALDLLRDTVKSLTRQALIEPQLLSDLRNC